MKALVRVVLGELEHRTPAEVSVVRLYMPLYETVAGHCKDDLQLMASKQVVSYR